MQFYSVKKREKVEVPEEMIKKRTYSVRGGTRYALRGTDDDGTVMTKFVSKDVYEEMDVPVEE